MLEDLKTIYQLVKPSRGDNHAERIENFYSQQSGHYDHFRKKLLAGRKHLFQIANEIKPNGSWIDFGAGTGSNLDYLDKEQIRQYDKIYLVDLSESLLKVAEKKIATNQYNNVQTELKNGSEFQPGLPVDLITFSYSLTMMPHWYQVLDHAYSLLSPDGIIAIVDFYISEKYPITGLKHHNSFTRHFWPFWFSHDNVFLNPDHLPYLLNKFEKLHLFEGENSVPYLPIGPVPYYSFVGRKPEI